MPNVIKLNSVTEGENARVIDCHVDFSAVETNEEEIDDLRFFKVPPLSTDDEDDSRYFYILPNAGKRALADEENSVAEDDQPYHLTPREEAQKIIADAEDEAREILEDAKKAAENLRMGLAAEISEAEIKKELVRNASEDLVKESREKADKVLLDVEENAKQKYEAAKNDGYAEGMKTGNDSGYKQGFEKGMSEGRAEGVQKGQAEGFAAGEKQGREEAYKLVRAEMAQQIVDSTQKAKTILINADKEKQEIITSSDDKIVKIAVAVAEKILNKEITENPFIILQIVKEAVQKVADQPRLFVAVSPENYEFVSASRDDIKKALGSKQEISFTADGTLGPADVIIGTGGNGDVDARLETQMNEIKKTIETVIRQ